MQNYPKNHKKENKYICVCIDVKKRPEHMQEVKNTGKMGRERRERT